MIINELNTSLIKGQSFHERLTEINIVTGQNKSGKSAIADSIAVGLYGHVPKLGETHAATFQLSMDPDQMYVELGFDRDSATKNYSVFKRDEKGGIHRTLNHMIAPPIVLLDVRDFFKKTEQERMKEVVGKVGDDRIDFDSKVFIEKIAKVEVLPTDIGKPLEKAWTEHIRTGAANRAATKVPISKWLDNLLTEFKGRKKALDASIKERQAVLKEMRHDGPAPKDVHADLQKAREHLIAVGQKLAQVQQDWNDYEQLKDRNEAQKALLEELPSEAALNASKKKLTALIKSYKAKTKKKPPGTAVMAEAVGRKELIVTRAGEQVHSFGARLEDHERARADIDTAKACPMCKCSGVAWRASFLKWWHAERIRLETERDNLKKDHTDAVKDLDGMKKKLDAAIKKENLYETDNQELVDFENQLEQIEQKIERRKNVKTLTESKLPPETGTLEALSEEEAKARAKVEDIEKEWETYLEFKTGKDVREQAEKAYSEAYCESNLMKLYIETIAAEYERIVDDTFNSLLSIARKFTDGIIRGKLEYRQGEIGYYRSRMTGGSRGPSLTWVPYRTFSGLEEMATFAGLSVALAQQSPIKLVIMDEMGRLSADSKRMMIDRIIDLQHKHVIDQFIGIDVSIRDYGDFKRVINEIRVEDPDENR